MIKCMKTLGIIPSRYASTRFPAKPLADIDGKSMLLRVWEQCTKSIELDEIVIATDDQRIYDHVIDFGGKVLMTRPDHQSGTDRCGEVLQKYKDKGIELDIVVNIQGDEPLLNPNQIDALVRFLKSESKADLASQFKLSSEPEIATNPNIVKVVTSLGGRALYFSRSPIPFFRNPINISYKKHIGLYAYRADALKTICGLSSTQLEQTESLEQLRWLEHDLNIYMQETTYENKGVDSPEDLEEIIRMLNNRSIEGEG